MQCLDESSASRGNRKPDHRWNTPSFAGPQKTSFRCRDQLFTGYFADVETGCQVYHNCLPDGRNSSFVCANGTIFNQKNFVCDWWYGFDCTQAPSLYHLNTMRNSSRLRWRAPSNTTLVLATARKSSRRAKPQYLPSDTGNALDGTRPSSPAAPGRRTPLRTPQRPPQSSRKLVLIPRLVPADKLQNVLNTPGRFFQFKNGSVGIDGSRLLNQTKGPLAPLKQTTSKDLKPGALILDVNNATKGASLLNGIGNRTLEELLNSTDTTVLNRTLPSKLADEPVPRVVSPAELQRAQSMQIGSFFPVKSSVTGSRMERLWKEMSPQLLSVELKGSLKNGSKAVNSSTGSSAPRDNMAQASLVSVRLHKIQDTKDDHATSVIAKHKDTLSGYCLCPCA
ncbi:uncharacterized protein LOC135400632 [Ornithodoros turicata]|uniref:uncharacterized protein LOC135400632 n=1 Tax=Ornithodoros turicata TaxID=34597 RepID=UPI003138EA7D